jgi:hypothetical protein
MTERLSELAEQLADAERDQDLAEGSLREAVRAGQWAAAHRAIEDLRSAQERQEEAAAAADRLLEGETSSPGAGRCEAENGSHAGPPRGPLDGRSGARSARGSAL